MTALCGLWDPSSLTRIEPVLAGVRVQSPKHWTTREFPRMHIIKKKKKTQKIMNIGEDMEKIESSCPDGGNVRWCSHCGKQDGGTSRS